MAGERRRLPQRGDELVVHVIDLDRGKAQPGEPGYLPRLAHEARKREAGLTVAVAAEVDPGQDDLAVALGDSAPDLAQHGGGAPTARPPAHQRYDAEVAREATAVLHLDERADPLEARLGLDAADRAYVACHDLRRLLARPGDDGDVRRHPCEGVPAQVGAAARHVDALVRAGRARDRVARLPDCLVCHAARVDDRHVGVFRLDVAVGQQPLAHFLRVRLGDLAPEETDREARHGAGCYSRACRSAAHPSSRLRATARKPRTRGTCGSKYPEVTSRVHSSRGPTAATSSSLMFATPTSVFGSGSTRASARRKSSSTPFAAAFASAATIACGSQSSPTIGAKPSFAAAIASTPEPQPTSSKDVGSSSLRSSRQSRVVGCDPVPNARPGSIVIASSSCGACSQGGTIQMRPARTGRWKCFQRSSQSAGTSFAATAPKTADIRASPPASV